MVSMIEKVFNSGSKDSKDLECFYIDIDRIIENPNQPRHYFDDESLEELSQSIKEYGIIQPLNVRKLNLREYELVSGERRLRAAKLAGLSKVPVVIVNIDEKDSAVIALIENIQRENLNFMEEAEAYQKLIGTFGFTQDKLSKHIGKSQSAIANKIRLLKLNSTVKKVINDNNLTERHARALLKLSDENEQLQILKDICDNKLNVKDTENLIDDFIISKNPIDQQQISQEEIQPEKKKRGRKKSASANQGITKLRTVNDFRLFENSIKQSLKFMNRSGINANYKIVEKSSTVEFVISIPTM